MNLRIAPQRHSSRAAKQAAADQTSIRPPSRERITEAKNLLKHSQHLKSKERAALRLDNRQLLDWAPRRELAAYQRIANAADLVQYYDDVPEVRERAPHYLATAMTDHPFTASNSGVWARGVEALKQLHAKGDPRALEALATVSTARIATEHAETQSALCHEIAEHIRSTLQSDDTALIPDLNRMVTQLVSDHDLVRGATGRYRTQQDGFARLGVDFRLATHWAARKTSYVGLLAGPGAIVAMPIMGATGGVLAGLAYGVYKGFEVTGKTLRKLATGSKRR